MIRIPQTAILANGSFPTAEFPLRVLKKVKRIVCCDGAVNRLCAHSTLEPTWVVGDLDSVDPEVAARFPERLVKVKEQETNDLAKAFRFCKGRRWRDLAILGATGLREDHTLGNLSLLVDFAECSLVTAFTDTGYFTPVLGSAQFTSFPGQQVSIFSFDPHVRIYSEGLKYPLDNVPFTRWWRATLNQAAAFGFKLVFEGGPLLVFQTYGEHE